ncbi:MAG: hypothetical protein WKF71_13730 [Pyrinomonadaceae bacterium]
MLALCFVGLLAFVHVAFGRPSRKSFLDDDWLCGLISAALSIIYFSIALDIAQMLPEYSDWFVIHLQYTY